MAKSAVQEREELVRELEWTQHWQRGLQVVLTRERRILSSEVYSRLRQEFSGLCLILAPRNQQRFEEVFKLASQSGWQTLLRSQLPAGEGRGAQVDVLILDTIGELARFYSLAISLLWAGAWCPSGVTILWKRFNEDCLLSSVPHGEFPRHCRNPDRKRRWLSNFR